MGISKKSKNNKAPLVDAERDDNADVEYIEETSANSKLEKSPKKKDKKSKDGKEMNKKKDVVIDNEDPDSSMNNAKQKKHKISPAKKSKEAEKSGEEKESDDEPEGKVKNEKANKASKKGKLKKNSSVPKQDNSSKEDDDVLENEPKEKSNKTSKAGKSKKDTIAVEKDSSSEEDENSSENEQLEEDEHNKSLEEANSSSPKKQKQDRNSLIIGNLPYTATSSMLQELLLTVLSKKDIKDCNIAAFENGKTKGFAYVEVTSKEAMKKVLQLNGSKMESRKLLVAINDKRIDKIFAQVKNTLHIGYVCELATDGQVIEFLEKFIPLNEIVRFERVKSPRGAPMGYVILEVASEEAVEQIKKLNGEVFEGKALKVSDFTTSIINPNFISTHDHNSNKKRESSFGKRFSYNRRSGNMEHTNGNNKKANQSRNFKKRPFSGRSDENQKQQKSKKPRANFN